MLGSAGSTAKAARETGSSRRCARPHARLGSSTGHGSARRRSPLRRLSGSMRCSSSNARTTASPRAQPLVADLELRPLGPAGPLAARTAPGSPTRGISPGDLQPHALRDVYASSAKGVHACPTTPPSVRSGRWPDSAQSGRTDRCRPTATPLYTRAVERAYRTMWKNHCRAQT
jgi:hypothetical protein